MSRQDPVPDQLRDRLQSSLGPAYVLERELGGGGMARVFLATDAALGRQVAVKVLSPEAAEGLSTERFTREIRLAAALQDPHIVPVLIAGQTADGLPYFTMPFVSGESLRERIRRGRLPLDEALRILRDVAEALEYAHARGVVHRDIKPENVLLSGRHAVVADFGIAKAVSAARADAGVSGLTSAGTSLGTPAYMAPEQAVGDVTDHRADLYAWGMVAYELLSGAHPFADKKTQRQLVAAQVAETPPPLDDREAGLPPGIGALVMACLAKDPADRPADAAAVLAGLDTVASSGGTATSPASSPKGRAEPTARRRRLTLLAVVALAVLAGAIALGTWFDRRPPAIALAPDATPALAVLPFEHQGDSAESYITDGITDEIRGRLTGVRELMVIARASSNQAAGSGSSPAGIAKALGARYLLTGTVRVVGSGPERRVVVRPELVEVMPDGRAQSRWQAPFDAEFSDVIAVQSDIARRVVSAMELPTSAADRLRTEVVAVRDPVAYDLFLRAEAKVDWGASSDAASNLQAIPLYEAAIARDSTMVEAWGALTGSLVLAYANGVPTRALAERSRVAALRTLALDSAGVIGTTAHGLYLRLVARDKLRALEEYRRAVLASPNDPAANGGFAVALFDVGRLEEALQYFEKARRLDPRQPPRARAVADVLAALGRLSEARALASQAWSVSPAVRAAAPRVGFELAVGDTAAARQVAEQAMRDLPTDQLLGDLGSNALGWVLGSADVQRLLALGPDAFPDGASGRALARARHYWLQGDSARMREWADSAQRLGGIELREVPDDTRLVMALASAEAFRERGAAALELARRAIATERRLAGGGVSRNLPELLYFAAEAAMVAGERDATFQWLGELLGIPSIYTAAYLRVDPTWKALRGDPRFVALLAGESTQGGRQ